jgi:hypothetical protein
LGCTLPVLAAYNTSLGKAADLYEAFTEEFGLSADDDLFWLVVGGLADVKEGSAGSLADRVGQFLMNELSERVLKFGQAESVLEADVQKHLALYEPAFVAGRQVVLIGHSQGNFVTNIEYRRIVQALPDRARQIGLVAIATPDEEIAGDPTNSRFTTFRGDFIRLLSDLGWNIPDAHAVLTNPFCALQIPVDLRCHLFQTYLDEDAAWAKVYSDIRDIVLVATGAALSDDFNDNLLDPSRWFVTIVPPSVGTIAETNQRLEMVIPTAGAGYLGLASKCRVSGDFDVQVDFSLVNWPAQNWHGIRLVAQELPGSFGLPGVYRGSFSNDFYQMRASTGIISTVNSSDLTGTMRLTRTGSLLQGYYRSSTGFVLLGQSTTSTTDTRLIIDFADATGAPATPLPNISMAFDNFRLNSGTVVCP